MQLPLPLTEAEFALAATTCHPEVFRAVPLHAQYALPVADDYAGGLPRLLRIAVGGHSKQANH